MSGKEILRFVTICVAVGLVLFFVLSLNFWLKSHHYYWEGVSAEKTNQVDEAINLYDQSIRSYCLFNPWVKKSQKQLLEIAQHYEAYGNLQRAVEIYQVLLSALASIETGYSGRGQLIAELERKVEELRKDQAQPEANSP